MSQIQNRVYKLKKATLIKKDLPLQEGQELEIVTDVVYMNGYMLPPEMQNLFYSFIKNNPSLFDDVTKKW